jgi:hypothetical protein
MKNSFLNRTLNGTKLYIIAILGLSAVYSRLLVLVPMLHLMELLWEMNL